MKRQQEKQNRREINKLNKLLENTRVFSIPRSSPVARIRGHVRLALNPHQRRLRELQLERQIVLDEYFPLIADALHVNDQMKIDELAAERDEKLGRIDTLMDMFLTSQLRTEAQRLDLPMPDDSDSWRESFRYWVLVPSARLALRKMIDEERNRRREAAAWWWKTIILPALTLGIGILGAITGLVAVIYKH
jgi:hypothetical protein